MDKKYLYRIYNGVNYLGLLDNVTSEPVITQDLNTSFAQLGIIVEQSADVIDTQVEVLQDELGNNLQDEVGGLLYEERRPDMVGSSASNIKIQKDNTIMVYEISTSNPNGILIFNGWITDWEAEFGGNDNILITALSKGVDLQEYIIGGIETVDISQSTQDATATVSADSKGADFIWQAQSLIVGAGVTNISSILVKIDPTGYTGNLGYINLVRGFDGSYHSVIVGNIGTASHSLNNGIGDYKFTFAAPITVVPGETLFFYLAGDDGLYSVYYKNSDVYASGNRYNLFYGGAGPAGPWTSTTTDLYFKTYTTNNGITAPYVSQDPTAIFTGGIDVYNGQGGNAVYAAGSTDNTGLSVTYTFKLVTALGLVKKALELAPSDWFWYISPGSLTAYFKQTATTATHKFIKRKHLKSFKLKATTDYIANKLYLSGGDTGGGTNLLSVYTNSDSGSSRQRLALISDNRVTLQATADTLADNYLDERADETHTTTLTILDEKYDISTIKLGDTVGFAGFGYLADSLILQIVRLERHPDYIILTVGKLPPRETTAQAQALQDIAALQTVDNPSTPS